MLNFKFKSKLVFFDDVSVIKTMQQADFMDIFWQAKHNQIFQRFDSAVSAEWQRFFHLVSWKVQSSAKTGIIFYTIYDMYLQSFICPYEQQCYNIKSPFFKVIWPILYGIYRQYYSHIETHYFQVLQITPAICWRNQNDDFACSS